MQASAESAVVFFEISVGDPPFFGCRHLFPSGLTPLRVPGRKRPGPRPTSTFCADLLVTWLLLGFAFFAFLAFLWLSGRKIQPPNFCLKNNNNNNNIFLHLCSPSPTVHAMGSACPKRFCLPEPAPRNRWEGAFPSGSNPSKTWHPCLWRDTEELDQPKFFFLGPSNKNIGAVLLSQN